MKNVGRVITQFFPILFNADFGNSWVGGSENIGINQKKSEKQWFAVIPINALYIFL